MGNKFGDAYREEQRRIHRRAMQPRRREPGQQRSGYARPAPQQPEYEQPPAQPANNVVGGIVAAAMNFFGALGDGGSLATGALPGNAGDAYTNLDQTAQTMGYRERSRRLGDMQSGTSDHGNRRGWSGRS